MQITLLLLILALTSVFTQDEIFPGRCPFHDATTVEGFQQRKFEGTWYEIQNHHLPEERNCTERKYEWKSFGDFRETFSIHYTERDLRTKIVSAKSKETVQSFKKPGHYVYSGSRRSLWILDTDYNNYAILWSCQDKLLSEERYNVQSFTLLARRPGFALLSTESLRIALNGKRLNRLKTEVMQVFNNTCGASNNKQILHEENSNTEILTIPGLVSTLVMILAAKLL